MFVLFVSFILLSISSSEADDCVTYYQDGSFIRSSDCYVVDGCDFSFPDTTYSYAFTDTLKLDVSFTDVSDQGIIPGVPFVYSGKLHTWYRYNHTYHRWHFQIEYIGRNSSGNFWNFTFSISNIQPQDAGTYNVRLADVFYDGSIYNILFQRTFRLFVYQPASDLVCQTTSSWRGPSLFSLTCSIPQAVPSISLVTIDPIGCDFEKQYNNIHGVKKVSIYIRFCDQNSTVGCIASQERFEHVFPTSQYYQDSCEFAVSKTDKDTLTSNRTTRTEEREVT